MNWDRINDHVENLVPGLALGLFVLPLWDARTGLKEGLALDIAMLGAAYVLGVLANVAGRVIFDPVSENWSRPFIFRLFCAAKLVGVRKASKRQINAAYNRYCEAGIRNPGVAKEMAKRRRVGRLVRSSVFSVTAFWVFLLWKAHPRYLIAAVLGTFVLVAILYGYAEATILHEAFFAVPDNQRRILDEDGRDS